jgi:hypothetical protein
MIHIIGVDFDNTIAGYDELIHRVAVEWQLIPEDFIKSKRHIRDFLRTLPDGEITWQKVQGVIYGPRMAEAVLLDGVAQFFGQCIDRGIKIFVVSHKTEFANYDPTRANLHDAAVNWLHEKNFFSNTGIGLPRQNVWFETSRADKIRRIGTLGCTHFVDDLEENFLEPSFPEHVQGILYAPQGHRPVPGVKIFSTWGGIEDYFFRESC